MEHEKTIVSRFAKLTYILSVQDPRKYYTGIYNIRKKYLSMGYIKNKIKTSSSGTTIEFKKCVTNTIYNTEVKELEKYKKDIIEKYKK